MHKVDWEILSKKINDLEDKVNRLESRLTEKLELSMGLQQRTNIEVMGILKELSEVVVSLSNSKGGLTDNPQDLGVALSMLAMGGFGGIDDKGEEDVE